MEKQGVLPATSSNNGLAAMRPRRRFLFEMIPRWIWSLATNDICYSSRHRETKAREEFFPIHARISTHRPYLMVAVSYTTSGEECQVTSVTTRLQTVFEFYDEEDGLMVRHIFSRSAISCV